MFFMELKGLDSSVLEENHTPQQIEYPFGVSNKTCTGRVDKFASWTINFALPLLQTAHPELILDDSGRGVIGRFAMDNRDIHRDPTPHDTIGRDVIFLTLGITSQGKTSGTAITKNPRLDGKFIQELPRRVYGQDIIEAPSGYATVFRPHVDFHASPREIDDRTMLYRAVFNFDGTNGLRTPDSPYCLDI